MSLHGHRLRYVYKQEEEDCDPEGPPRIRPYPFQQQQQQTAHCRSLALPPHTRNVVLVQDDSSREDDEPEYDDDFPMDERPPQPPTVTPEWKQHSNAKRRPNGQSQSLPPIQQQQQHPIQQQRRSYHRYDWDVTDPSDSFPQNNNNNNSSMIVKDVTITVGDVSFPHSRTLLSYASPNVLRHILLSSPPPQQHNLHFLHHNPDHWQLLQPFLEPHAIQPATITMDNLPVLLFWFDQLELSVLLKECDTILQHYIERPNSIASQLWHCWRLLNISKRARLKTTCGLCFEACAQWMEERPSQWLLTTTMTSTVLESSSSSSGNGVHLLQQLCRLLLDCLKPDCTPDEPESLEPSFAYSDSRNTTTNNTLATDNSNSDDCFSPPAARKLFTATLQYVPDDCLQCFLYDETDPNDNGNQQQPYDRNRVSALLHNPLFVYLVREGIHNHELHASRDDEDDDDSIDALPTMTTTSSTMPAPMIQTAPSLDSSASFQQAVDDLQMGLQSLWGGSSACAKRPTSSSFFASSSSSIAQQQQQPLSKTERRAFLERIWKHLQQPNLFDEYDSAGRALNVSRESTGDTTTTDSSTERSKPSLIHTRPRTFAC